MPLTYWCEHAWLPDGVADSVLVTVDGARIAEVPCRATARRGARRLPRADPPGPGQRPLPRLPPGAARHDAGGQGRLLDLARPDVRGGGAARPRRATSRWPGRPTPRWRWRGSPAWASSTTCTTRRAAAPYDDANAMGHALVRPPREAGLRIALLDTCYLVRRPRHAAEPGRSCGSATGTPTGGRSGPRSWPPPPGRAGRGDRRGHPLGPGGAGRADAGGRGVRPPPRGARCTRTCPSSGPRTTACLETYGGTPDRLLHEHGALGPRSTAVHATHLTERRHRAARRQSGTHVCMCPTTERDLADGIGPARTLYDARLAADARLRQPRRDRPVRGGPRGRAGRAAGQPSGAATGAPPSCCAPPPSPATPPSACPTAGSSCPARWADLVTVRLDSVRTAGAGRAGGGGVRGDGGRRALGDLRRPPGGQRRAARAGRRRSLLTAATRRAR